MKPSIVRVGRQVPSSTTSRCTAASIVVRQFHSSPRSLGAESSSPRPRSNTPRGPGLQSRPPFRKPRGPRPDRSDQKRPKSFPKPEARKTITTPNGKYIDISDSKPTKVVVTSPRASSPLTASSLITNHVATASASPHAHRATILSAQAHLARRESTSFGFDALLAKALRFGKVVRFANEDEKLRAVALAQEHSDTAARRLSLKTKTGVMGKRIEFMAAPKSYRDELVGRVAKGNYQETAAKGKGAVAVVGKQLWLNESYLKKSGIGFLSIIKRLMPQPAVKKASS